MAPRIGPCAVDPRRHGRLLRPGQHDGLLALLRRQRSPDGLQRPAERGASPGEEEMRAEAFAVASRR
jgi:hypothetical protein